MDIERLSMPVNKRTVEGFMANSLTNVLYSYPYLFPYMKELAGFDPETLKHSICVAETATTAFVKYASEVHMPEEQLRRGVTTLALGGLLHDIGKAGLDRFSLEDSYKALKPEESKTPNEILRFGQNDLRTSDERDIIHLHPPIGGNMVRELCNVLPISKEISEDVADFAFSHHEKPDDLRIPHGSYSRKALRLNDSFHMLLHTFLSLSDIAVSMREPRRYRNYLSLPKHLIASELKGELSNRQLKAIFGKTLSNSDFKAVRNKIVTYITGSLDENDDVIVQKEYQLEGVRVNGSEWISTPTDKAVLIPKLVKTVWNNPTHEARFLKSLDESGKVNWHHFSREDSLLQKV